MTPDETAVLQSILGALHTQQAIIASIMYRVERLEAVVVQLGKRMQLQEAGTALYEIEATDRGMN